MDGWRPVPGDLPATIPVFPLTGALLLPHGKLPLNIFEPRYKAMVEDALADQRMIGMIQPGSRRADDDGCRPVPRRLPRAAVLVQRDR